MQDSQDVNLPGYNMSELMNEIGIGLPYLEYLKQSALMDYSVECFKKNDFVFLLFFSSLQECFLSLSNNHYFI